MALNKNQSRFNTWFATTHWSLVLAAGDRADSNCTAALEGLCVTYWYPLYAYTRHRGLSVQDAEDATQAFFARLLEKDQLARLTEERGKFRAFLITAMKHFLNDQWRRDQTLKRGAGRMQLSLDLEEAETRYQYEPVETTTPETLYEQNWAMTVLATVFETLEQEQRSLNQEAQFEQLKFCLTSQRSEIPYDQLAEQLQLSESNLRVKIHRLRQRYRELLREEVAHTVSTPEEVEEELRYLFASLTR